MGNIDLFADVFLFVLRFTAFFFFSYSSLNVLLRADEHSKYFLPGYWQIIGLLTEAEVASRNVFLSCSLLLCALPTQMCS